MTFIKKIRQVFQKIIWKLFGKKHKRIEIMYDEWKNSDPTRTQNPIVINSETDIPTFLLTKVLIFDNTIFIKSRKHNCCPIGSLIHWKKVSEEPELYSCWIVEKK